MFKGLLRHCDSTYTGLVFLILESGYKNIELGIYFITQLTKICVSFCKSYSSIVISKLIVNNHSRNITTNGFNNIMLKFLRNRPIRQAQLKKLWSANVKLSVLANVVLFDDEYKVLTNTNGFTLVAFIETAFASVPGSSRELQAHSKSVRVPSVLENVSIPRNAAKSACARRWAQVHRLLERVSIFPFLKEKISSHLQYNNLCRTKVLDHKISVPNTRIYTTSCYRRKSRRIKLLNIFDLCHWLSCLKNIVYSKLLRS